MLFAIGCNILEERSIKDAFSEIDSKLGRVDVLVNNAGGSLAISQPLDQIDVKDWEKVIDLNLRGTFCVQKSCDSDAGGSIMEELSTCPQWPVAAEVYLEESPTRQQRRGIIGLTRQSSKDLGP